MRRILPVQCAFIADCYLTSSMTAIPIANTQSDMPAIETAGRHAGKIAVVTAGARAIMPA
jgi:hypothetical protein